MPNSTELTSMIDKLTLYLGEVERLKELSYTSGDLRLWADKVRDFLQMRLGENSEEYRRFGGSNVGTSLNDPAVRQKYYLLNIKAYESSLKSVIQRLGMQITDDVPAEPTPDRTSTPLSTMHSRIQEVAGSLFNNGHNAQAIFEAFKAINNVVKDRSGLNKDGQSLMAEAFNDEHPVLLLNDLNSDSDRDEQAGFKLLYMGAMTGIRNPYAHENVPNPDEARTLEYLSFASLLMRRLEEATRE